MALNSKLQNTYNKNDKVKITLRNFVKVCLKTIGEDKFLINTFFFSIGHFNEDLIELELVT